MLVGIDGCPGGWVAAATPELGSNITLRTGPRLADLLESYGSLSVAAIDMPIGLPETGRRRCDEAARQVLGARRSTVFFAPPRCVLDAASHAQAGDLAFAATGKRVSIQAWNLVPKIREVAELLGGPRQPLALRESHPELCFAQMNGGEPIAEPKKTPPGRQRRLALLQDAFGECVLKATLEIARRKGSGAPLVDQIDSLACLYSAGRIEAGVQTILPGRPRTGQPTIEY